MEDRKLNDELAAEEASEVEALADEASEADDQPESDKAEKQKDDCAASRFIYDIVEIFAITTCIVLLVFTFIGRIAVVDGSSMNNTLSHGDVLLVSDFEYNPRCGDIVVFSLTNDAGESKKYVKRVIATGGQVIDIDFDTWTVTVDGKVLDESTYAHFDPRYIVLSDHEYPLTVPDGYVFVMGDNRNLSLDSRSDEIGFVDERVIFGRVLARMFPMDSISIYKRFPITE